MPDTASALLAYGQSRAQIARVYDRDA
jgi:hypothetical protein